MPLLLSLLGVIALSASIAYWVLQLYKPEQRPLAAAPVAAVPEPAVDAGATLFGGQAAGVVATNYQLTGVVAAGRNSVAILVAEGQPPKALVVGKEIAPGVSVTEVHPRYVMLSEGGVPKRIELAVDPRPAAMMSAPLPATAQGIPDQQQPPQQQPEPPAPLPQSGQSPEPPPPAPIARPSDEQAPPPPPVQMPPPTRTIGVQGQPPVSQ
ncbi:type II secretion system protein N [Massilia cavernae]|uniref:type II secretion system protein N n=1 Tax=Massilia cavernae TaxID=2320864 RepID=UPI0015FF7F43|nr:type II secretion system protein N [Massilia cavernae]